VPITFAGQSGTGGVVTNAAPGPVLAYNSTAGNTLIVAGQVESTTAITGITSITDDAGNAWQFSVTDSQDPPSVTAHTTYYFCTFVAWCIDAAPVTLVSVEDSTGITDNWLLSISEWRNISAADNGVALTGTNANPAGIVDLTYADDLVVGSLDSNVVPVGGLPPGWTSFSFARAYAGYGTPGVTGPYTARWRMASDTYTLAVMSFYSNGDVTPPRPGMRAF